MGKGQHKRKKKKIEEQIHNIENKKYIKRIVKT